MKIIRFPRTTAAIALGIALVLTGLALVLVPHWPPQAACTLKGCKEGREWISSAVTVLVLLGGLLQYRRAELWKRAEFLAEEMRTFFTNDAIARALTMVDWTARRINLLNVKSEDPKDWSLVTRVLQNRALLPHKLKKDPSSSSPDGERTLDSDLAGYTREEVAIRDDYDALLDGLERFASFVSTGLVSPVDLQPYLRYWVDDIAKESDDRADNEWTFFLLAYIEFYRFTGVQELFKAFGYDIRSGGSLFKAYARQVGDPHLAGRIIELLTPSL